MPKKLTKQEFEAFINSKKLVLVDFFATWCGPCIMLSPILEEVEKERQDVAIGKVDVDEEGELAERFEVSGVPTLVLFLNGEIVDQRVGFAPKSELLKWIDEYRK
ncbi:MAG: thioredoxin [Candidatus Anstonellaceae archaeon]